MLLQAASMGELFGFTRDIGLDATRYHTAVLGERQACRGKQHENTGVHGCD